MKVPDLPPVFVFKFCGKAVDVLIQIVCNDSFNTTICDHYRAANRLEKVYPENSNSHFRNFDTKTVYKQHRTKFA
jgi:hypothetical protein